MIIQCINCTKDIHVNILNWEPYSPLSILCDECQKEFNKSEFI